MLHRARLCLSMSSVCPSVCDVQVPWNSSKIIWRLVSETFVVGRRSGSTGTPPKLGWNIGVGSGAQKPTYRKFTAASRGSPCDSSVFLYNIVFCCQNLLFHRITVTVLVLTMCSYRNILIISLTVTLWCGFHLVTRINNFVFFLSLPLSR